MSKAFNVLGILRLIVVFIPLVVLTFIILINGYLYKNPLRVLQKALHNTFASKVIRNIDINFPTLNPIANSQEIYIIADWLSWAMLYTPSLIQNLCVYAFIFLVPGKKEGYKDLLTKI